MKFLPLVIRNLLRSKRRTFLTILSVAVSLFVFAALMSLPGAVNQILHDRADSLRLACHSKGGIFYSLPEAYARRILAVPHVEAVIGENLFIGTYRGPDDQIPSAAIDPENVDLVLPDFGISSAAFTEFQRLRTASLVGSVLMNEYHWRVGDRVTLRGTILPVDIQLTIVGTMSGRSSSRFAFLFRRDYLKEVFGGIGYANLFIVKVDHAQSIPDVIAAIDRTFANSPAETETESELTLSQGQMGGFKVIFNGAKLLAAIVILAIGLVAANTAAMSVRQRRHEIAVMRAIGFPRAAIVLGLLAEGAIIGTAGGLLGCGLAWVALWLLPRASSALGPLMLLMRIPLPVFVESLTVAIAIGALGSLAPAVAATRSEISAILRAV